MPKTKGFGKSIWEGNDWIAQCVTKSVRALENSFSSELNWYCSMIHHLTWNWTPSVAKVKCRENCVLVSWLELSRWPTDTGCCHKTGPHGRWDRRHRHLMRKGHTRQIRNHRCHKQVYSLTTVSGTKGARVPFGLSSQWKRLRFEQQTHYSHLIN